MAKYIDADEAMQIINNYAKAIDYDCDNCKVVIDAIKDIVSVICPTADVEEVKHGNWVLARRGRKVVCSCCETPAPFDNKLGYHTLWCSERCLNCGAKMDGGKTE